MTVVAAKRTREKLWIDVPFTKAPASPDTQVDGSGDLTLSGYASTWSMDRDNELVKPNAFDGSLKDYLSQNPIVLWQHCMEWPIGTVTSGKTDTTGLYITVKIPNPGPDAADWQKGAYIAIKNGIVQTFSIGGYFSRDVDMGPDGPVFTIVEVDLFEISCVSIPANATSIFEAVMKSWHGEPPTLSPKAQGQLEQLIGFVPMTDPELAAMDDVARGERFKQLTILFQRANDGAEPPAMGTWSKVVSAQEAGVSPLKVAQAKLAVVRSFYLPPEGDEKAGRAISAANRSKLEDAMAAHQEMEDHLVDAAESMKAAAASHQMIKECVESVMGIGGDDDSDPSRGTADDDEQEDDKPSKAAKAATDEQPDVPTDEPDEKDAKAGLDGDPDEGMKVCPTCKGDGTIRGGNMTCPDCDGDGQVKKAAEVEDEDVKAMSVPDAKGALSAPSASFAPRDTSWDGSAAKAAIKKWSGADDAPNAKYKQAFLWQDGDGSTFGDLKYPVCTVSDGELRCVFAGVSAAAARANQQGLDALKPALTTLYNRAAKQFSDSSIKPPWSD